VHVVVRPPAMAVRVGKTGAAAPGRKEGVETVPVAGGAAAGGGGRRAAGDATATPATAAAAPSSAGLCGSCCVIC
jgi:hypothetical protein